MKNFFLIVIAILFVSPFIGLGQTIQTIVVTGIVTNE